jgi:hypothetical protein
MMTDSASGSCFKGDNGISQQLKAFVQKSGGGAARL